MKEKKETAFEGYMSGDHECFCLCIVPFEEWVKHSLKMPRIKDEDDKAFWKWNKEHEALTLYPSYFFPKECKKGKWKFKITVEAEKVK